MLNAHKQTEEEVDDSEGGRKGEKGRGRVTR